MLSEFSYRFTKLKLGEGFPQDLAFSSLIKFCLLELGRRPLPWSSPRVSYLPPTYIKLSQTGHWVHVSCALALTCLQLRR
jgi:hypothetical protein